MWPVPTAAPDNVCWCFKMPTDGEWTQIVRGALAQITRIINYSQGGSGLDIEDVIQYAQEIYDSMSRCFALSAGDIFLSYRTVSDDSALLCDGSTYAIDDYPELAATLAGITWSDANNFKVPDMRSRLPVGTGQGTGLSSRALDGAGGTEDETLSVSQIPGHRHNVDRSTLTIVEAYAGVPAFVHEWSYTTEQTSSTGGDGSHNNMPPFIGVNFYIVTGL